MARLKPKSPPGRPNRKARAFHDEICRLRNEGYSLTAIRQALEEAGVTVSTTTVLRESRRPLTKNAKRSDAPHPSTPAASQVNAAAPESVSQSEKASSAAPLTAALDSRSPQQRADAFMATIETNPLLKRRTEP